MQQFDAGAGREHLHRDMQRAVGTGGAVGNLPRALLGVIDKILQRLPRRRGRHREQGRIGQHARDRRELRDFVGHRPVEQPVGLGQYRQRRQCHQQRVAVGLGARRLRIADRAAGAAGAVVDDDGLAEDFLQRRRHRPRREIGLAAGRKRHDHGDVAGRIGLREGGIRERGLRQRQRRSSLQQFAAVHRQFSPQRFCFGCWCNDPNRNPSGGQKRAYSRR